MKAENIVRVTAMRTADTLSRVNLSSIRVTHNGYRVVAEVPPPIKSWPDIDVDTLFPLADYSWWTMMDDGSLPAVWPIDEAIALPNHSGIRLFYCRTRSPKELRGRANRVFLHNVEAASIDIDQYGSISDWGTGIYGRVNKQWISLNRGGSLQRFIDTPQSSQAPAVAIGIALRHRYEWSTIFTYPTGIRLRYGCSAEGVLSLFKDRESPSEGRRKALLHWVRRHWRRTSDPTISREVRKHLRGITKFDWRGQDVSIIPAEYELEQAKGESK